MTPITSLYCLCNEHTGHWPCNSTGSWWWKLQRKCVYTLQDLQQSSLLFLLPLIIVPHWSQLICLENQATNYIVNLASLATLREQNNTQYSCFFMRIVKQYQNSLSVIPDFLWKLYLIYYLINNVQYCAHHHRHIPVIEQITYCSCQHKQNHQSGFQ